MNMAVICQWGWSAAQRLTCRQQQPCLRRCHDPAEHRCNGFHTSNWAACHKGIPVAGPVDKALHTCDTKKPRSRASHAAWQHLQWLQPLCSCIEKDSLGVRQFTIRQGYYPQPAWQLISANSLSPAASNSLPCLWLQGTSLRLAPRASMFLTNQTFTASPFTQRQVLRSSSAGPDSLHNTQALFTSCVASSAMTPASGRRRAHERLTLPLPCHSLGLEPGCVQMETVSSCGSLACAFLQPHGSCTSVPRLDMAI